MLFKNKEVYELTKEDVKAVTDHVGGRFPVTIKFVKELYVSRPTTHPRTITRKDRPRSIIVPFESSIEGTNSMDQWNYTELPPVMQQGHPVFYTNGAASAHNMTGRWVIQKNRMDLLFYLIFKCPLMRIPGKENSDRCIEVMNEQLEAATRNLVRERRTTVEGALFGPHKLHISEVTNIAKIFDVAMADEMDEGVLRDALMAKIEARESDPAQKDGYAAFIEYSNNQDRNEVLVTIRTAKDMKRVIWVERLQKWVIANEDGKKVAEIGGLLKNRTKDESLEQLLMESNDLYRKVKMAIEEPISEEA